MFTGSVISLLLKELFVGTLGYNSNLTAGHWYSPQGGIVFIGSMNMCFVREDNGHPFHTAPYLQYVKRNDGRPEK